MPQAPIYKRKKNFTENSGNATDHTALNDEFDAVAQSINDLRKNQSSILTDEGKLQPDLINPEALSEEAIEALRGPQGIEGPTGPKGDTGPQGEQGPKGETGASFSAAISDVLANRSNYDNNSKGFSFLAIDEGRLYWKLSDAPGDWSVGVNFGQGPKGDQGATGAQGPKGDPGIQGIQGEKGDKGDPGKDGEDGAVVSIDSAVKSANLIGRTRITAQLVLDHLGQLSIKIDTE